MLRARLIAASAAVLLAAGCSASTSGRGSATGTGTSIASTSAPPPPTTPTPTPTPTRTPSQTRSSSTTPARSSTAAPASSSPSHRPHVTGGTPTVVLNPGHNGGNGSHTAEINRQVPAGYGEDKACDTTGTTTNAGYPEHAFNWDVSLRVRRILQRHGVHVIMTRPDDSGVGPCVDERAAIGNHAYVAAVISIHADGAPSSGHGFHVNQDSQRPDGATATVARQSLALGQAEHEALAGSSGLVPSTYIGQNGYYFRRDLAGLNLARRPATFLELGNMRNAGDAQLQSSSSGRARIARAVAAGILAYLGR